LNTFRVWDGSNIQVGLVQDVRKTYLNSLMEVLNKDGTLEQTEIVVFGGVAYTSDKTVHNIYETWKNRFSDDTSDLIVNPTDKLLEVFNGMNYCWNYISFEGKNYWLVANSVNGQEGTTEVFTMNPESQVFFGMYRS